jgi:autotransporter adhesin
VVNVADGSQATDAVNVRQLQASQQGTIRYDTTVNGATNYNSVTLGSTSSGPTTVRNVAAGTAGTDAVNVDQLKSGMAQTWIGRRRTPTSAWAASSATCARPTTALGRYRVGDGHRSAAAAQRSGPQHGLDRRWQLQRRVGRGAGISGVSEGGRWIYKFSGSTNSRGEAGVAVGAGIQW